MLRRVHFAVLVAAGVCTLPATVLAQRSPSFVTPTTTTTGSPVIVTPTTTTVAPVVVTPTTTTVAPVVVTPTTTTVAPVVVTPTTTTVAPVVVTPTTTAPPLIVTPTTPTGLDDLVQATVAPDGVLGEIDPSGAVPEGLDLTAFPGAPEAPTPAADGPTLAAGLSCAYQCIKSGVAYARGFGALLVVETQVPARLFMTVVDADNDLVDSTNLAGMESDFSWALDHLEPGQTYVAMVVATDENNDSSYAWGEFTTLSERTVHVTIGDVTVEGGPQNVSTTMLYLQVDGGEPSTGFATWSTPTLPDVDRHLDLRLWVERSWAATESDPCGNWSPTANTPLHSDSDAVYDAYCLAWNSAMLANVDLDAIPAGRSSWTDTTVHETFTTGSSGGALPDGFGDPLFFHFSAPLTLYVTYS